MSLPEKLKQIREDGILKVIDADSEVEILRHHEESDLDEDEMKLIFKTIVRLWNEHNFE